MYIFFKKNHARLRMIVEKMNEKRLAVLLFIPKGQNC